MVKGCQKKTVHIKNTGSRYYEEAYFVLRRGAESGATDEDMIKEALKIAEESVLTPRKKKGAAKKYAVPFMIGFVAGVLLSAAAVLIFL